MSKPMITRVVAGLVLVLLAWGGVRAVAADAAADGKLLHHVVAFKFKETATPEQIKAVEDAFAALPSKISEMKSLHWGTDCSPEKFSKGFTHCFVAEFASEADRDTYLAHPDHKAFGKIVGPVIADIFVVDFWDK